ncbi:radical SAM protein [Candidatus Fermentibacteria bacterium]|nr:MAG: radical SAM protein [Candidatus Fermentibacteria bacterium]
MKVIASSGRDDLARVYIVEFENGLQVECAESLQPPLPLESKWVMLVSTLFGCPVRCTMCDAGSEYHGKLSASQITDQIEMMVHRRFPSGRVPSKQFKVQFARMGEPALNPSVIDVLRDLPRRIDAPGFMPSVSTVAPEGTDEFFKDLLSVKRTLYSRGNFQLQFSLHTTDTVLRRQIVPANTWTMSKIAAYGNEFHEQGDRKVTLNFALAKGSPLEPEILLRHFDPEHFLVKITPLNPTYRAMENNLTSQIDPSSTGTENEIVARVRNAGYQVILSIGEQEENRIGSNCGQYLKAHINSEAGISQGYTYPVRETVE